MSFDDVRVQSWRKSGKAYDSDRLRFQSRSNTSAMPYISIYGVGEIVVLCGYVCHQQYIDMLWDREIPPVNRVQSPDLTPIKNLWDDIGRATLRQEVSLHNAY